MQNHLILVLSFAALSSPEDSLEDVALGLVGQLELILLDAGAVVHHLGDQKDISADELHGHLDEGLWNNEDLLGVGVLSLALESLVHLVLADDLLVPHEDEELEEVVLLDVLVLGEGFVDFDEIRELDAVSDVLDGLPFFD